MAKFSIHIFPGATFDRQAFWSHIGYPVTSFGSLLANFRALTQSSKGHFVVVSKLYIPVNHAFLRSLVWTVWRRETQPRAATAYKLTNER